MRRLLFVVCLCLVTVMGLMWEAPDRSQWDGAICVVTGQVYQKSFSEGKLSVYLKSIDSFVPVSSEQEAATRQRRIPFTDNLICEYEVPGADASGLIFNAEEELRLGSTVRVMGEFRTFSKATNPGEFDSGNYYASLGIAGSLTHVTLLEKSSDYSICREGLYRMREYFRNRLQVIFPEKYAGIMSAMLLGDKAMLDGDVKALYQNNGIIHILSISGLHITLIGISVHKILRKAGMPVWMASAGGGVILILYGVMTGMSVSAGRAIGMYLLRMLAEVVGRTYDMLTALGVMGVVIVWSNPGYLRNAGFYLSFGAVLGLGVLYPVFAEEMVPTQRNKDSRWRRRLLIPGKHLLDRLGQSMLSGLSVTLMTFPIQLWFFYELPTYSVIINLLILPFMNVLMTGGLLAMLIPGGGILGTVDCVILDWYEWICSIFEMLPLHTWNPGKPYLWQPVIYYLLLMGAVFIKKRRQVKAALLTVAVMVMVLPSVSLWGKDTTITFLDVGQGDCICVELASGEVYLFDCGSTNRNKVGESVLKPFLKYRGIDEIDGVFVSHEDTDHYSGVAELLENAQGWGIDVGALVLSGGREGDAWEIFQRQEDIPVSYVEAGEYWQVGRNRFTCLHPGADYVSEDGNEASQCFFLELDNDVTVLLTGDVEGRGEAALLAELQKRGIHDVDILKVAHHGSRFATGEALLKQISPALAVISCAEKNFYGHPHKETYARLEKEGCHILLTAKEGAIVVK